jgi:hypothetical protein
MFHIQEVCNKFVLTFFVEGLMAEFPLILEISAMLEPLRLLKLLEIDMSLWGPGAECYVVV